MTIGTTPNAGKTHYESANGHLFKYPFYNC